MSMHHMRSADGLSGIRTVVQHVTVFVSVAVETQDRKLLHRREGAGKHEFVLLRVQVSDTVSDCSDHSGVSVSFVSSFSPLVGALEPPEDVNSVHAAKLVVESSHQVAIPRCIMGGDGSLEGMAPNRRTSGTHLIGHQLVHTSLLWRALQAAPGNQVRDLVVLRRQHWHRLGDVLRDPGGVLSQGCPNTCPLRVTVIFPYMEDFVQATVLDAPVANQLGVGSAQVDLLSGQFEEGGVLVRTDVVGTELIEGQVCLLGAGGEVHTRLSSSSSSSSCR